MRDDRSESSPLDQAAGTASQAAQTAGQVKKAVNQAKQGAKAAQKAAHTSQAAYAATASAQGGAAAAGATTGTALCRKRKHENGRIETNRCSDHGRYIGISSRTFEQRRRFKGEPVSSR